MGLKCLFGHKWIKVGGLRNVGDGQFEQQVKCSACCKIEYRRS